VAAAAVFLTGGVASAQTSAVNCGDVVNGNVSLNHDLVCPSTDGLDVGSPGTIIHLNGHKIICPDGALPCNTDQDSGIYGIYDNTQIVGPGTISGFYSQVTLEDEGASTLMNVKTDGGRGCWGTYGTVVANAVSDTVMNVSDTCNFWSFFSVWSLSSVFLNNTSTGAGEGFFVGDDLQDTLQGNVATHDAFLGFDVEFADHASLTGNKADHTLLAEPGIGFGDLCSTYSTYTNNQANANASDGFNIFHSSAACSQGYARIKRFAPSGLTYPADHFAGLQVAFTGNLSKQNGCDGVYFDEADGSEDPANPGGSTITNNTFLGNGCNGSESYQTYASQWAHNTSKNNTGNGYYFDEPAADRINGNTGSGNGEDGLQIFWDDACGVAVGSPHGPLGACDPQWVNFNTFVHNSEFGAFASDTTVSMANVAHDNGTAPVDCVNVNCQSHALITTTPALAARKGAARAHAAKTFSLPPLRPLPAHH
jgi:hypothetical protein